MISKCKNSNQIKGVGPVRSKKGTLKKGTSDSNNEFNLKNRNIKKPLGNELFHY
jgi:hypothetical protein